MKNKIKTYADKLSKLPTGERAIDRAGEDFKSNLHTTKRKFLDKKIFF